MPQHDLLQPRFPRAPARSAAALGWSSVALRGGRPDRCVDAGAGPAPVLQSRDLSALFSAAMRR